MNDQLLRENTAVCSSRLMFIAGEASGDRHAAAVISELKKLHKEIEIFGAGGAQMQAAGMELLVDLTQHAVVGLIEVAKNFCHFRRIFQQLMTEVTRRHPNAVVLVDFGGFNLRFARAVKKRFPSTQIIYFISPQVWASRAGRVRLMERYVDLLLSIFSFEKNWFARHAPKLKVEFIGHPFVDEARANVAHRENNLILLLPGSRDREVQRIFPLMTSVVERMPSNINFVAVSISQQMAQLMRHPRISVQVGDAYEFMRRATLAITKSGTATMECAFFSCPMVVIYRVNWLTYLIGKMLVRVKWLAMPNLIAGHEIVPELIQQRATPETIHKTVMELLQNDEKRQKMQQELATVVARLGPPHAYQRAANAILRQLQVTHK